MPRNTTKTSQLNVAGLWNRRKAEPRKRAKAVHNLSCPLCGEGNNAVSPNAEYQRVFAGLQEKLRAVLPKDIGFLRLEVRMPEVVLVTSSGDFALDAMSGGINSLFGIVWQIYMFGIDRSEYTVAIDEPENHLHPSMQRIVLPNLARAFPNIRFVVATHSPFIVSSFPEAAVYALFQNEQNRVVSSRLVANDLSGTPNRVLREVLDVESNLPLWVEDRIRLAIEQSSGAPEAERADRIMNELRHLGISDIISEYIEREKNEAP